jgi:NAD(P)-dependent dehydrogenase (short-subunit alcohol dehydrogenase family)
MRHRARDFQYRLAMSRDPGHDAIASCIATIEALRARAPDDPDRVAVERAAAYLNKDAKLKRRLARKQQSRRLDREAVTGSARAAAYFGTTPAGGTRELRNQRHCYVCKQPFRRLHAFYHALCEACAERNFAARSDSVDLGGRRAIVTGGRVKIGFEVVLALLAAGARVTVTTRFPRDAERRFAEAIIDGERRDRLRVVGLDFLDVRGVLRWIESERDALDILINNAAQTVRRPPAYYAQLAAAEQGLLPPPKAALDALMFPDRDDEEGKPLDLRPRNSWVLDAGDVEPAELAEVHVVNAIVPFLLATRLRPLFAKSAFADRYIVNVSAMEGVFAYPNKQPRHPHTNMAKAALNMFTRTSAADYIRDGIYMNSVDTGWITQENPHGKKQHIESTGFCPPLDIVDGSARVIAPILRGVRGDRIAGAFFKDYEPAPW